MAYNANKETQYLILDSLSHGAKYGLEVIEYISQKTNGAYILKKPTLYSCLSRMEKKGLISSSYWGESDLGGKRHYFNVTNSGKQLLEELSKEYANSTFTSVMEEVEPKTENTSSTPLFLQQDNIFDMVKEEKTATTVKESKQEDQTLNNQIDFFSFQKQKDEETREEPTVEKNEEKMQYYQSILEQTPQNNARFLDESERLSFAQEEQNKRLYDTSSELKKYRKRKSFSENQIEMSVVYENEEDQAIQRQRIEQLKASMLGARQNRIEETERFDELPKYYEDPKEEVVDEPQADDGVFINTRVREVPIQKKITPPNIDVEIDEDKLPAPKRNSNLEPTYKDMLSKLFEKKKEDKIIKDAPPQPQIMQEEVDSFVDYNSLKRYYKTHDIEFKEYSKTNIQREHNTNFLNFITSVILLCLSGISSAILFAIISFTEKLNVSTNWLFYTIPLLFLVYCIFAFIRNKVSISKKATLLYNGFVSWAIFILGVIVVIVINVIAGMQFETMGDYLTSTLTPTLALLIAFPINHYVKKFLYSRYSK